ncbi:MAG TPA: vitamin K epoxide reductase family protein [Longimicrobium sp.]|nr:vitamin K epoxide reductase family protein [Longimicrobium sp.]
MSTTPAGVPADEEYPEHADPPRSRMGVALLSLLGLMLATYLTLYKLGYIGTLECTTGGCEKVQQSQWAFFLGQPVALWGVVGYLLLLIVSMLGLQPRWAGERWVALAIFALAAVGLAFSGYLTFLEARVIHAWCQWCVVSAILMTLIFLLSIPGLRRAR